MPVVHAKTSAIADSTDTSLVRPTDWNAGHVVLVDLATETAGLLALSHVGDGTSHISQFTNDSGYISSTSGDWTGTFDGHEGSYYLARANHTGTQLKATISDFVEADYVHIAGTETITGAKTFSSAACKINVNNSNNTAMFAFEQSGSGNAAIQLIRTGVRAWEIGIDASSSNSLRIGAANDGFATPLFTMTITGAATFVSSVTASSFIGPLTGNADTATKWASGRTLAITGDMTYTSPSFDGSGNVTATGTLATVNSNVGSFGSSTSIPTFTANGKGQITAASGNAVIAPAGTLTGATINSSVTASSLTSLGSQAQALNMNSHQINNVTDPSSAQDVATKAYVDATVTGLLDYRGSYDASTNLFPAAGGSGTAGAILKGDFWICSVAGTLAGEPATAGDLIISIVDTPGQTAANWDIIEHDIGTYVSSVTGTANRITSTGGSTPTIDISASYVGQSSINTVGTLTGGATGAGFTLALGTSTLTGDLPFANLTQGSARSILGVTGNATADFASIQGVADQVARINGAGTALAFGAIDLSKTAAATGVLQAASFPALTGDITTSAGAVATTLATVNSNVGTFGSVTKSITATANAKGLITAISEQTVTPAVGSITGLGTGVGTFLATPSSANLASALTDEVGTAGSVLFGTAWTAGTYNAGNFTVGAGGGTWTVQSGDLTTYTYALIGKTMVFTLRIDTATLSGTATYLLVTVPGGYTLAASRDILSVMAYYSGTAWAQGWIRAAGGTTFQLFTADFAAAFPTGTNNLIYSGQITCEIQ